MDDIKLCCPSYKKPENLITYKMFPGAVYYVHQFEIKEYINKNPGIIIKVLPNSIRSLPKVLVKVILENNIPPFYVGTFIKVIH